MKRISCIAAALATASAVGEQLPMEHVLVSVPLHKKQAETALPVTVLSGEALQRRAAASIGETLGNQPGIASASFGPGVGRPVIRGQQGPRTLTLQNGTASADVSSLSPDHAVAVEALLADSIEVLRGPSTLLYGGGAIGGVVNVIDNRIPRAPQEGIAGALEYRHDEASGMDNVVYRLDGGTDVFAFHLSGVNRESDDLEIPGRAIDESAVEAQESLLGEEQGEGDIDNTNGHIANTDTDVDAITGGGSFQFGEQGFIGLAVSYLENKYGIPPGAHGHEDEEGHDEEHEDEDGEGEQEEFVSIDLEQTRYDGMLHLHNLAPGIEVIRGFLTYTDYQHDELEGSEVGTRFERDTWETRLELVHGAVLGAHGVAGLQLRADDFSALGEEAYVPQTDSTEWGLFLVEDFHRGDWTYEIGARGDWVERDPDSSNAGSENFSSLNLAGSALWSINAAWQAGLSLSRSARAPATEELFSNIDAQDEDQLVTHAATGVIEIGDPTLDEEVSLSADITLGWWGARSWAQLTLFYNQFEDYIFLANSGMEVEGTPVYLYSQDDADFYGVELESEFHLTRLWEGDLTLNVFGDMISGEFDDNGDVPRLPPRRLGAGLNWSADTLGAWLRVIDAGDQDDPGDFETRTEGYTRWDAGLDYRWQLRDARELFFFLKWKNIGDEEIRLSSSFLRNYAPQAGQSVEAGLRFSF